MPSSRRRGDPCLYDGRSNRGGQYFVDGSTITVCIEGRPASTLEFEADEYAELVELTIYETHPVAGDATDDGLPSTPNAVLYYCELTIELDAPLGHRTLTWKPTGQQIPVSDIAKKRRPTNVPEGWDLTGGAQARHRETNQRYGPVELTIVSPYTRSYNRIVGLQNNVNHEMIELHGTEAVWIQRPNGSQRLSFIVDEWFYDLFVDPGVDRNKLLTFARSFK